MTLSRRHENQLSICFILNFLNISKGLALPFFRRPVPPSTAMQVCADVGVAKKSLKLLRGVEKSQDLPIKN
jgi:hypothetical protein